MSALNEPIIEVSNVSQRFGDTEILRGVEFNVDAGEIVGLLGPNGAGKSTTVDLLAGLTSPSSGRVRVLGVDPATDRATITAAVGVQPQQAALFPILTVDETLALFASFHERPADLHELRARVQLEGCRGTQVRHLSGGELRRLLIGIALVGQPRVVILDEPSAGLDPASRLGIAELIRTVRAGGTTVLLTTHHLDEAEALCHGVLIMRAGQIVLHGDPAELARAHAGGGEVAFTVPVGTERSLIAEAVGEDWSETELPAGGSRITARSTAPDELLRRVTFTRGLRASGITVRETGLADVYLRAVNGEP